MAQCNHCHTEYGGIRGISIDRCPRCKPQESVAQARRPAASLTASWRPAQRAATSLSSFASPLLGPIAQLDRAARI
jgi:hypothetical protein